MLNRCEFIGNLGQDPEVRNLPSGGKVVNLSIGITEKWKDKNTGEQKDRTEWVRCVIFSEGLTRVAEAYLHKGSRVYIAGQMQTRKWQDQSGQDKYSTEIVLQSFNSQLILLDGKQEASGETQKRQSPARSQAPSFDPSSMDDDIPF